jgi:hypothetical protein
MDRIAAKTSKIRVYPAVLTAAKGSSRVSPVHRLVQGPAWATGGYIFSSITTLLTGTGGTPADELRRIDARDVLIAFSFSRYGVTSVLIALSAALDSAVH